MAWIKKSGVTVKNIGVVQKRCESWKTVVRWAVFGVQGGGGTAPRIHLELLLVCCGDGQTDS